VTAGRACGLDERRASGIAGFQVARQHERDGPRLGLENRHELSDRCAERATGVSM
jgi:hypothetical protein